MANAVGYPIYQSFNATPENYVEYTVTVDGKVSTFRVYGKENETSVEVDLSDVFAQYLNPKYEDIAIGGPINATIADSVKTFTVSPGGSFTVCYNYNTDYKLDIATGANLNRPITDYVDPRQLIGSSVLGATGITLSQAYVTGAEGSSITVGGYTYKVLPECRNRYALYYMNLEGGLDYLICNGRCIDRWNSSRTNVRLYSNRQSRLSFENTLVYQDLTKQYSLNTGWISEERAQNIEHLTSSPKIFIHNLDDDTVTACIPIDTNTIVQRFRNDGMINYQFNISESQLYRRM